jgi:FkbH-like protein
MRLIEALEILRRKQPARGQPLQVSLVTGFTPLHLQTFLAAQLGVLFSDRQVSLTQGFYGDFWGNLIRLEQANTDAGVVLLEWRDLDPRLGLRNLGSWAPSELDDILQMAKARVSQFHETLPTVAAKFPVAICFPTLPFPPVAYTPTWQASAFEIELRECVISMHRSAVHLRNVRIASLQQLDRLSPLNSRLDMKSELASGFPYKLAHASILAEILARLIQRPTPKKGLITDLDDTLWSGILGEVGIDGISWDLEHQSHMHGVYQRFLHALSETGVLVGVASKNDSKLVSEALQRKDMILPASAAFPVEAQWGAKSESVGRILKTWNIGADAVVFVDDSPMELAEVQTAHSQIECIRFPKEDPQAIDELLHRLRDLFGKNAVSEEDAIRRESIRLFHELQVEEAGQAGTSPDFLKQAEAELTLNFQKYPSDPRVFDLVNKTNQFNLNGKRYTDASWLKYIQQPDTLLLIASYRDKYGPLGKIAVLAGQKEMQKLHVHTWVMSCRAFSRRIEHRCIEELFERFDIEEIIFDFASTPKNRPIQEFLAEILGSFPVAQFRLPRKLFLEHRMETFHRVLELTNE